MNLLDDLTVQPCTGPDLVRRYLPRARNAQQINDALFTLKVGGKVRKGEHIAGHGNLWHIQELSA